MDGTELNLVILPDDSVREKAISFSEKVAQELPVSFVLNNSQFRPHITIYMGKYPDKNVPKLKDAINRLIKDVSLPEIKMHGFEMVAKTFLFWNSVKSRELQDLHEKALLSANPLRDGLLPQTAIDLLPIVSEEDKKVINQTGGLLNHGDRFHPHITISRLENTDDSERAVELFKDTPDVSFKVDRLYLARLGIHGTVSDIEEEFKIR